MKQETNDIETLLEQVREEADTPSIPAGVEGEVRTLDQLRVDAAWTSENNLLGDGYLRRGQSLLLAAPAGVGKSALVLQGGIHWALGRDLFGIRPQSPLSSLLIQAENDDGDLVEMRDGVFAGMGLKDDERDEASGRVKVVTITSLTGPSFVAKVEMLVEEHRPDLVVIDPLFSYLGGSVSDQALVSAFLRNGVNPILFRHRCGLILVHHTNKPRGEGPGLRAGDHAYIGSGSAELANWARAVLSISNIGSHTVFEVHLGKRGQRAGLKDKSGARILNFHIQHSKLGIYWERADDAAVLMAARQAKGGDGLLALIPEDTAIVQSAFWRGAEKLGVNEATARRVVKELIATGEVHEWHFPRAGRRPEVGYCRRARGVEVLNDEEGAS